MGLSGVISCCSLQPVQLVFLHPAQINVDLCGGGVTLLTPMDLHL